MNDKVKKLQNKIAKKRQEILQLKHKTLDLSKELETLNLQLFEAMNNNQKTLIDMIEELK